METVKREETVVGILEEDVLFSLEELCRSCFLPAEQLLEMVDEGIIEPVNYQQTTTSWQFAGNSVVRVRTVIRLQRDLGVNLAGAALAVELLDEIKALRKSPQHGH
ncbi:MAG: chaperone modulator CbpM [Thiothrix sp.]|uniref:chaperone modulator CbpM n=1 Tax=Thiothrix sp. TaxID=1032 RepID=UPI00262A47C8|nr:chaperone modulator CbpM [Thiothrix sp.]MDD5394135.1 chaperone modulator CbpM [Thiothrix sp.]